MVQPVQATCFTVEPPLFIIFHHFSACFMLKPPCFMVNPSISWQLIHDIAGAGPLRCQAASQPPAGFHRLAGSRYVARVGSWRFVEMGVLSVLNHEEGWLNHEKWWNMLVLRWIRTEWTMKHGGSAMNWNLDLQPWFWRTLLRCYKMSRPAFCWWRNIRYLQVATAHALKLTQRVFDCEPDVVSGPQPMQLHVASRMRQTKVTK